MKPLSTVAVKVRSRIREPLRSACSWCQMQWMTEALKKDPGRSGFETWPALIVGLALVAWQGCGRREAPTAAGPDPSTVRGGQIQNVTMATSAALPVSSNQLSAAEMARLLARPDPVEDGFIRPGFDKLSAFRYELYEFYSETNSGRALLASHDSIPPEIKAYDGKRIAVTGYILPLRTRRGVVTEFLLLRDQGTCCFGAQAQINHFIRVIYPPGIRPGDPVPWKVSGTIHVGETYVQGYLTGIFQLDAESVVESRHGPGATAR